MPIIPLPRLLVLFAFLFVFLAPRTEALADNWSDCESQQPDQVIRGCTAVINARKDDREGMSDAYAYRGWAYRRRGETDRAIADFNQAISLDPKQPSAYYNRGLAYKSKGDYDRAISDYTQAIPLYPQPSHTYNNRGNTYLSKGDYDRAIADFDQAIKIDSSNTLAIKNRDKAYRLKGESGRAAAPAPVPALTPSCPAGYVFSQGQCISNSARASSGSAASSSGPWVFIVRKSLGVRSARDLDGANVCVVAGSPSEAAVNRYFRTSGISFSPVSVNGDAAAKEGYQRNSCDVLVVEQRIAYSVTNILSPPGVHQVLPEQFGGSGGSSPPPIRRAAPTKTLEELLQEELKRIGCYTGGIDGDWGSGSRAALRRFSNQAGLRLGSEPSQNALDEAKNTDSRYCTPVRAAPKRKKPKKKRNKYSCGKNGQYNEEIPGCECFNGYNWNGSRCVQRKTVKQLPRCANAVNAICEGVAHKQCEQHSDSDRKFGACVDKAEASCARSNGCR